VCEKLSARACVRGRRCIRDSLSRCADGGSKVAIIAAAAGGACSGLLLIAVVVLVLRARRNASAVPAGLRAPLTADAAPAGVHQLPYFGAPAAAGASQRPTCENDGSCYRQNPAHWADFHHAKQHAPVAKPVKGPAK
jgi:hypothetical protein